MTACPIVILGAGGHAKVVLDLLTLAGRNVIGAVTPDRSRWGSAWCGLQILGGDEFVLRRNPAELELANGIGSVRAPTHRRRAFLELDDHGFRFVTAIHPSAVVADSVTIAVGVQIMAGAVVQPGTRIGRNSIINTGALVDHDCVIGEHVHIAPGCTLSGGIVVEDGVHVGTGATVLQGMRLGAGSCIGAGAVVIRDVQAEATVVGVPARFLK